MAATTRINETNGTAPGTETTGISTGHYGTTDTVNIAAATTEPITPGNNSYEKWWVLEVVSGTYTLLDKIRVYSIAGSVPGNTDYFGNQDSTTPANTNISYSTATDSASTEADTTVPTADPGVGSYNLFGDLASDNDKSGFWVTQVQVGASETTGNTGNEVRFRWREQA